MILHRYIAGRFLWMFARVFAGFFGILLTIDVIEQLRRFSGTGITLQDAAVLAAMNAPSSLYRILPLVMILSAIGLFLGLARSSELVVIRAAGRSGLRFLMAPVIAALVVGAVAVGVLNPIVAATSKQYDLLSSGHARNGSILSISESGLWLRQGTEDGQTVIQAARANLDGTELYDATFLTFAEDGTPLARIEAATARLEVGFWSLSAVKQWPLTADNPERDGNSEIQTRVPTDLTRDTIRDSFGTPSAIAIWDLPGYIAGLERAGFSARSHRVWMQMEFALPLFLVAMVLIAAGFTMRHSRLGKSGAMVLLTLLCGFVVFFMRNFGQVLAENGQIPIGLAVWTPPVAAALLAMGLLLHVEDG